MAMATVNVHEIGTKSNYNDVELNKSNAPNKYGTMYYLAEKIYLKKSLTGVADYGMWESDEGKLNLVLHYDADLFGELQLVMNKIKEKMPGLDFKEQVVGDRMFVKTSKKVGKVPEGMSLTYIIQIYGVFTQHSSGKSYLQMEITEVSTKNFSLLSDN